MNNPDDLTSYLYYQIKIKALLEAIEQTPSRFYRKITRWYSREFSTTLENVRKLPLMCVLREYYESELDNLDEESIIELAKKMIPAIIEQEERENQAFADSLIEEQERSIERARLKDQKDKERRLKRERQKKIEDEKTRVKLPDIDLTFDIDEE